MYDYEVLSKCLDAAFGGLPRRREPEMRLDPPDDPPETEPPTFDLVSDKVRARIIDDFDYHTMVTELLDDDSSTVKDLEHWKRQWRHHRDARLEDQI